MIVTDDVVPRHCTTGQRWRRLSSSRLRETVGVIVSGIFASRDGLLVLRGANQLVVRVPRQ